MPIGETAFRVLKTHHDIGSRFATATGPRALLASSPPGRSAVTVSREVITMIRKLPSGEYRLYSRKRDPKTGRRRNLGTFKTRAAAERRERAVQYFKHRG